MAATASNLHGTHEGRVAGGTESGILTPGSISDFLSHPACTLMSRRVGKGDLSPAGHMVGGMRGEIRMSFTDTSGDAEEA